MRKTITISLIIFLISLFFLLLIWKFQGPKEMKMNQININQKGEVKIIGEIISSQKYENFQVLKIQDSTGTIKGILNSNKNFSGNITIIGTIAEYNKEPEIEIHKIIFLS